MNDRNRQIERLVRDPRLKRFHDYLLKEGLGLWRRVKYLYMMRKIFRLFGDDFDLDEVVKWIMKEYRGFTRRDYMLTLKYYMKSKGVEVDLDTSVKKDEIRKMKPTQLLTEEEVKKLIDGADDLMMKVMISLLWETGMRTGELLNISKEDVQPTYYGFLIRVKGKTGVRPIPILDSSPILAMWLEKVESGKLFKVSEEAFRKRLRDLAKEVGIKKRVYPYLFRHTRATLMAKKFGEEIMKKYFGWVEDSDMPAVYVHLSASDVEKAILEKYGLESRQVEQEGTHCWRCGHRNMRGSRYCSRCGSPLDQTKVYMREQYIELLKEKIKKLKDLREDLPP